MAISYCLGCVLPCEGDGAPNSDGGQEMKRTMDDTEESPYCACLEIKRDNYNQKIRSYVKGDPLSVMKRRNSQLYLTCLLSRQQIQATIRRSRCISTQDNKWKHTKVCRQTPQCLGPRLWYRGSAELLSLGFCQGELLYIVLWVSLAT